MRKSFVTLTLILTTLLLASACKEKPPQWIAFISDRDGNYEIYKMRADGSQVTRLTNNLAEDWAPSWGP